MANDTYKIIHYDSADTNQTDAISDLEAQGGVVVGSGIVDGAFGYHEFGILHAEGGPPTHAPYGVLTAVGWYGDVTAMYEAGGNLYDTGVISYNHGYSVGGLLDLNGEHQYDGLLHNGVFYDGGIFFEGVRYSEGVYEADGTLHTLYGSGSSPYQTGYAAAPQSDILGTGLL